MTLRLGVIGLSPGNGHPYSWSAIFNGYDPVAMQRCGFPVIEEYLAKQTFPRDCIKTAKVTHVWTQDIGLSRMISNAALIPNIANNIEELIKNVDAVLLARDDANKHLQYASPVLQAGMPIYIDKPFALSVAKAHALLQLQKYPGQIFSCSAIRYARELRLDRIQREEIGGLLRIDASAPNDWERYAIHIIDPVLRLLDDHGEFECNDIRQTGKVKAVEARHSSGIDVKFKSLGRRDAPISIDVTGTRGKIQLVFRDTFGAFRATLKDFVDGVVSCDVRTPPERLLAAVKIIEFGCRT